MGQQAEDRQAEGRAPSAPGLEKNTLTIGSGETYEWLVDFGQQSFQSTYPAVHPESVAHRHSACYDPTCRVANATGCPPIPAAGDPLATNFYIPAVRP